MADYKPISNRRLERILDAHELYIQTAGTSGKLANLSGYDLSSQDLSGRNLENINLSNSSLEDAILNGCKLDFSTCVGTNFRGAKMRECGCAHAAFASADFGGAEIIGCNFSESNLEKCTANKASIRGTSFEFAHMPSSSFLGTSLKKCDLSRAILTDAVFRVDARNIKAQGTEFTNTDMRKATFYKSDLGPAYFSDATLTEAKFANCDLTASLFHNTKGEGVTFKDSNLHAVDMRKAFLPKVTFVGSTISSTTKLNEADLTEANFRHAQMKNVVLDGSTLDNADFKECTLSDTSMNNVSAIGVDFSEAEFKNVVCESSVLIRAVLERAEFKESSITNTTFDKALLNDAAFNDTVLKNCSFVDIVGDIPKSVFEGITPTEPSIRVQSTADLRDITQRDELLRQAMSAVHGSNTPEEQQARMRDAGYEDWEIAEELAGRAVAADSLRSYDNIESDYFIKQADKAIELRSPQMVVERDPETLRAEEVARSVHGKSISNHKGDADMYKLTNFHAESLKKDIFGGDRADLIKQPKNPNHTIANVGAKAKARAAAQNTNKQPSQAQRKEVARSR